MLYVMIAFLLLLVGGAGFGGYMLFGKKKEAKEDNEKYIPTTQDHLPFEYIRSGIVKLKKNGYRMIVELPSINIDLMEASEKQLILEQYREILNAIDFKFQFLQQSRIVDISEYLSSLEKLKQNSKSKFAQNQLEYYSNFLVDLIKNRSILTKKFYLIIPYDPEVEGKKKAEKDKKKDKKNKKEQNTKEENDVYKEEMNFEKARKQLYIRATMIERSFRRFEISPKILKDNELLELFYTAYNKDRSVYQPLKDKDPADYTSLRVKKKG